MKTRSSILVDNCVLDINYTLSREVRYSAFEMKCWHVRCITFTFMQVKDNWLSSIKEDVEIIDYHLIVRLITKLAGVSETSRAPTFDQRPQLLNYSIQVHGTNKLSIALQLI